MNNALARVDCAPARPVSKFADAILEGLAKTPKTIACKYFYDKAGSNLFDRICELPEYYQSRTEVGLLRHHALEIAALFGSEIEIVEFGAGSLRKVRPLLNAIRTPRAYTPVDISGDHLHEVVISLRAAYPALPVRPLIADFTLPIVIPVLAGKPRRAGFFPGGTIGNFEPENALTLLRRIRDALNGGGLLIGVDLVKDPKRIHAAYNDAAGVTAAFNKNVLARANRELGTDFDLSAFSHYAPYNVRSNRIEMYLVSMKRQVVTFGEKCFQFAQGEPLHTEDSYKYTIEGFREIAVRAGFNPRAAWNDPEHLFSIHWLES